MKTDILYMVSLFPCWSETFIVREIQNLRAQNFNIRIASLKPHHEKLVHADAESLRPLVDYPNRGKLVKHAFSEFLRSPIKCTKWFMKSTFGLWKHPEHLVKTYATGLIALDFAAQYRANPPKRIHAHWATYPSTAAMIISDLLDVPFSFTSHAHDIFLEDHLLDAKVKESNFWVTISTFNIRFLDQRLKGLAKQPKVVHCGVDLTEFKYTRSNRQDNLIVTVGRLDEIKGFTYLLQACGQLKDQGMDFQCKIIGEGPQRSELESLIRSQGLENHVELLGAMAQSSVREWVSKATVFPLPSIKDSIGNMDGIPVSLMEAMALGTPVVSTRVSGIPELIEHQVSGWLCEPKDAQQLAEGLQALLSDSSLQEKVAKNARVTVEQEFDCEREAEKLGTIFRGQPA